MKYYIDIVLTPNKEDNLSFIWSKVYTQMHLALVEIKSDDGVEIGFSFPFYNNHEFPLGDTLRVFSSSKELLNTLNINHWLKKLEGFVYTGNINDVPSDVKEYVTFSRKQFKSNISRLARRYAKRHDMSIEEALDVYKDANAQHTDLPFVYIKSLSTDQEMKIFIEKSVKTNPENGLFSTYGLSKTSTVPWF
jgi:CRISPR-associated endonuclease Csy4